MSKPVKEMVVAEYRKRFADVAGALVIDIRGIGANDNNQLRLGLRHKNIRITVVKNSLARKALAGTVLEGIGAALDGPAALAYSDASVVEVAREIVAWTKKIKTLALKGAILDGQYFEGKEGIKRLSEFPTKEEAQARVIQLVLSPAGNVVGAAKSPGAKLLGIVKEIQDRLEKGQTISKVA
jgi:large subunit ribosomal protein L10